MTNREKVSIIVPVYNMEEYLSRCIDSLLVQSYQNIQVILVNDGSQDGSGTICDRYAEQDTRVTVVHKPNGGLSSARNAGISVATGKYIGFVDSDDFVAPEMYEKLVLQMEKGYKVANIMYVRVDESGKILPSNVPHTKDEVILTSDFAKEVMLHTGDVSVCTKLFHKDIFCDLRFPEGKLNEDLIFLLDVMDKVASIAYVGYIGYYYFIRSGSISSGYGKAVIDMVENSVIAMEHIKSSFPMLTSEAERFALYQHMAYLLLVPRQEANKSNAVYVQARRFIRSHILWVVANPYLKRKNKLVLLGQMIVPRLLASVYQKKHK